MKLNVLYITFAIGLLTHSSQAAPLLGNVADVSSERVDIPAGGVHVTGDGVDVNDQGSLLNNKKRQDLAGGVVGDAEKLVQDVVSSPDGLEAPLDGTGAFAQKTTSDLGVSRRGLGELGGAPAVGDLTGTVENTLNGFTGLRKRSPLLDNQGDRSTGATGGLVDGLLNKRQALLDGTVGSLTQGLGLFDTPPADSESGAFKKRDGSNDDDGEDLFRHYPPPGATYGSGMAANNPAAFADAITKRNSDDEEGGDDESRNGENNQDRPGPPPAGLTDEQLDDFYTKRDTKPAQEDNGTPEGGEE